MKFGTLCVWILGVGLFLGVISPADITEIFKGGSWTLFQVTEEVDYQVEKSNEQVKSRDRPWNQLLKN